MSIIPPSVRPSSGPSHSPSNPTFLHQQTERPDQNPAISRPQNGSLLLTTVHSPVVTSAPHRPQNSALPSTHRIPDGGLPQYLPGLAAYLFIRTRTPPFYPLLAQIRTYEYVFLPLSPSSRPPTLLGWCLARPSLPQYPTGLRTVGSPVPTGFQTVASPQSPLSRPSPKRCFQDAVKSALPPDNLRFAWLFFMN
jgi:hypothetical protein